MLRKSILFASCAMVASPVLAEEASFPVGLDFSAAVVATGLEFPWEVTLGPDEHLWVTERAGKRVTRIDPDSGEKSTLVTIDEVLVGPQHEGLLGLALHPQFLDGSGNDFAYVVYTYDADPAEGETALDRRAKLVRFTYDEAAGTLVEPLDLMSGIPAGNDHNAGRLQFGPDGKLYYTTGEQGANQFGNFCLPINSQVLPTEAQVSAADWSSYSGKILRVNSDGSIPDDNPTIDGVRSHIFSYGHRNPQAIVFGPGGLYEAEQGPKSDDEINLIVAGGNYGWPHVSGFQDDLAYVYGNWSAAPDCSSLTFSDFEIPEAVPQTSETSWSHPDYREPLKTLWTVPNGYNFDDAACDGLAFICWPTIAPPSVDYYPADGAIPRLRNSLVATSLKNGSLYVFPLTKDGLHTRGDVAQLFQSENRYRDLAISGDTRTIYVSTDTAGIVRSADGNVVQELSQPGAILAFTYN